MVSLNVFSADREVADGVEIPLSTKPVITEIVLVVKGILIFHLKLAVELKV